MRHRQRHDKAGHVDFGEISARCDAELAVIADLRRSLDDAAGSPATATAPIAAAGTPRRDTRAEVSSTEGVRADRSRPGAPQDGEGVRVAALPRR
jgi:hypothetical protein